MAEQAPIHFLASFQEKDHFLQNYMYHVPAGGIFVDLGATTPTPLMTKDRRELVGQIAEVRLTIRRPKIQLNFRGAITFASPYKAGVSHRRVGVEFFRYESTQKNFLLDRLNTKEPAKDSAAIPQRRHRRFPANFRIRFDFDAGDPKIAPARKFQGHYSITGRTEELSLQGCSFHSIRFLKPGSTLPVEILVPGDFKTNSKKVFRLASRVRWNDPNNFGHRFMGVEFDYDDPQTKAQMKKVEDLIGTLQQNIETKLLTRRKVRVQPLPPS